MTFATKPTLCKECNQNADWEAVYHFRDSYHTSAEIKPIPFQIIQPHHDFKSTVLSSTDLLVYHYSRRLVTHIANPEH